MKVLIASDVYAPQINGVVTSILNLKGELEKQGVEVRILTLSGTRHSYYEDGVYYVSSFPIKIYPDIRASLSMADPIILKVVAWKPDIIHTQNEFSTFNFAKVVAMAAKCPIVHTYHTLYEHYLRYITRHERAGRKFLRTFLRQSLRSCARVIAPTEKTKRALCGAGIDAEVTVLPTGIDLSKFETRYGVDELAALKRELGICEDDFIFLFVGRVAEEKNLDETISDFLRFNDEHPHTTYLIVGGGPYLKTLKSRFHHPKIHFTGMIAPDDVGKYYQLGDVFFCASESETQGLTFIEALANGLPLLCRRDDCLDGLLVPGETGFFFKDYTTFVHGAQRLMQEDRHDLFSEQARKKAEAYSKETFGRTVLALYKDVLSHYTYVPLPVRPIRTVKRVVHEYALEPLDTSLQRLPRKTRYYSQRLKKKVLWKRGKK
ncbi:glycosyltransferase [Peptoniphilus equinus]|uniref:Glycosyltransferase n=1 Tax=Peptoniphilus equinus TaxID=3016343 RepID=A0ABY7QWJ9_9FIRM|nr:glycosyltransferase [Peptoniphilus equinus]WBW50455.1 glycosyltransferase [Peptoniphilus equinus]